MKRGNRWSTKRPAMARDGRGETDEANGYPDALDLLSDATRVSILRELGRADGPVRFAQLRRRVGMRDSGTFNHHLSKLVGVFVERGEAGYTLAPAGSRLITAADVATAGSSDAGSAAADRTSDARVTENGTASENDTVTETGTVTGDNAVTARDVIVDGDCPVCGESECERLYHVHLRPPGR